ncbi:MAG: transcriptional repressor [Spirochaetaceae bacterium]|nr:transcriptional repressor [Spirochaetaceae bacterium]
MSDYYGKLRDAGITPSVQRVAIYQYLCENIIHPTVDTMFSVLSQSYPTLSKTTIYNTVKLFEKAHLVKTIKIDDDTVRYDADMSDHNHFKCMECGKIYDLCANTSECKRACISHLPEGFQLAASDLYLFGLCPDCSPKETSQGETHCGDTCEHCDMCK